MTLTTLSDRERRLIAVAILVGLLALLIRGLVMPVVSGFGERAQTRQLLEMEYARNARVIASTGRIARAAERQKADLRAFIVSAPTAAAGGEALQERIQTAIENGGGEFRSAELRPVTDDQLRLRVDARMTLVQLTPLLADLQNRSPYLAIDALTITADSALVSTAADPLDVHFDVTVPFLPAAR